MTTRLNALLLACLLLAPQGALAGGSLLPNAEQTFVDANGVPYVGGLVYFYIPNTLTLKDTWQDPGLAVLNTNPVVLNAAGRAIIYGVGQYRQILKDSSGNTIWDQLTQAPGFVLNTSITGSGSIGACNGIFPINNTSGGPISLTMPSTPATGDQCQFIDAGNNSSTYAVTFNFGAKNLNTGGNLFYMNYSGEAITFTWMGSPALWGIQ